MNETRLLIDTHVFLWFIGDSPNLSPKAADLLESDIHLLLSVASLWEIAIKVSLKKLTLAENYEAFISEQVGLNDIELLPITIAHLALVASLPLHHRDPFDRLLIAQAMVEDIPIVSVDGKFDRYGVERKW